MAGLSVIGAVLMEAGMMSTARNLVKSIIYCSIGTYANTTASGQRFNFSFFTTASSSGSIDSTFCSLCIKG
jgi:hypothetical protein